MGYFRDIKRGIKTTVKGMSLTLRHFWNARQSRTPISIQNPDYFEQDTGITTLQFPHESMVVPDNGRYQLDCEIDDCIVCDKCAKICPVDCIDIEPIKSSEIISYASDGSPIRLYAARFDIDMAKCCFCGLCTTVCPTECLTMTNEYDFSVVDITQMNFGFSNLTPQEADEKRRLYEQFVAEKEALKAAPKEKATTGTPTTPDTPKPAFKPNFKPVVKPSIIQSEEIKEERLAEETPRPKPVFKPVMKTVQKEEILQAEEKAAEEPKARPVFKPVMKATPKPVESEASEEVKEEEAKPRASFKPVFKTAPKPVENAAPEETKEETAPDESPKPKSVFKPTLKIQPKKTD